MQHFFFGFLFDANAARLLPEDIQIFIVQTFQQKGTAVHYIK